MTVKQYTTITRNGFTLLEVMIAMVIFAVGLLGLAGMQSISMQNEHASYSRSQAVLLTYEMADRIKANPLGTGAYAITAATTSVAGYTGSNMCVTSSCIISQIVTYDHGEWKAAIAALLPSGQGSITTPSANNHVITVHWDEDRTGATGLNCPVLNADDLRCLQLSVRL